MTQIFEPGELVAERFEIVHLIAAGGMGQVYEAHDLTLGGRVAVKVLNFPNLDNEAVNRRFRREIQLARQVTHPNVCRIYDIYRHRVQRVSLPALDVTLVTMELLTGETLENHLKARGRLREKEVLPLARQMAAALDAAHDAGVIHRDFKPSNVILVPREAEVTEKNAAHGAGVRVVVTDFGLARSVSPPPASSTTTPLTGEMKVVGTADYMAPEQLHGEPVSPASDIYAFGVVLFEMVTSKRPYSASNPLALLTKRATEPPSSPLEHNPRLEPRWSSVILRCLDEMPEGRPVSATEVVELLSGEREWPQESGLSKALSGKKYSTIALGLIAVLLIVGLIVTLALRRDPRRPAFSQALQLTTAPGLEIDPAFSPDGQTLAFSSEKSGDFEIYVRDLGPGGRERRLTQDGGSFEPVFSPDGQEVVYHSASQGGIWTIPAKGGAPRQLSPNGARPDLSPDGRLLVFQSEGPPQISDTALPTSGSSVLWLLDLETGERRQLTRTGEPVGGHASPVFSPSGLKVAFTASQRGASEIWSVDLEGGAPMLLVDSPNPAFDPVFTADGRYLYFSGATRQVYALWSRRLDRRGRPEAPPVMIENLGLASFRQTTLSSDGTKMAYAALFTRSNLWSVGVDPEGELQSEPRPVTTGSSRNTRPSFSPDGSRVAWESWARGGNVDIWLMDPDGGKISQLTLSPEKDSQPSWLPGGEKIAFLRRTAQGLRLLSIELVGGREEELAVLAEDVDWARLAPDGRHLAFHSRGDGAIVHVFLQDLLRGEIRQLSHGGELRGFPFFSPDGRSLAFQAREGEHHQVAILGLEPGAPMRTLTHQKAQHYPFSFSPDGRKIAFVSDRGGDWNVWWREIETGEERQLTDLRHLEGYVRYPSWSPRGDLILYEVAESTGDIWIAQGAGR